MNKRELIVPSLLYLFLAVFYFFLNGNFGHFPSDDGSVLANAWRVFRGEVPYRDFISIRPPLSFYLHSLWFFLPEGTSFLAGRAFYYFEMALSGLLPALWAVWSGRICGKSPRFLALCAIFFAFATHQFVAMPWTTVDGVFVCSIGLTAFLFSLSVQDLKWRVGWRTVASSCFALAPFFKQGFGIFIPLFIFFGVFEFFFSKNPKRDGSWCLFLGTLLPGLVTVGMILSGFYFAGGLKDFFVQVFSQTQGGLKIVGILEYLYSPLQGFALLGFISVVVVSSNGVHKRTQKLLVNLVSPFFFLLFLGFAILMHRWTIFYAAKAFYWLLFGLLIGRFWKIFVLEETADYPMLFLHMGVLVLGWAASISWGYRHPMLGLAPMALVVHEMLPAESRTFKHVFAVVLSAILIVISYQVIIRRSPYGDAPRAEQQFDLSEIFPKFGRVYTQEANFRLSQELKNLTQHYAISQGRSFAVIPFYPLIHYLTDSPNKIGLDWIGETEYNGLDDRFRQKIEQEKPVLILRRDPYFGLRSTEMVPCSRLHETYQEWDKWFSEKYNTNNSELISKIIRSWKVLGEGRFFCVFGHPSL